MDSLVGALVQFMDAYYSPSELKGIVDEMVGELGKVDPYTRSIYEAALHRFSGLPALAWHFYRTHREHLPVEVRTVTEEASELLERGGVSFESGDLDGALSVLEELLQEFRSHRSPIVRDSVVKALANTGTILMRLDRGEEAIIAFDEVTEMVEGTETPELRPVVAMALVNKSFSLNNLGRTQDAIDVCNQLIARFPGDASDPIAEPIATALFNRGRMLGRMDRIADELAAYDELQNRFGSSESVGVLVAVLGGQVNKAAILFSQHRRDEALVLCEKIWSHFGNRQSFRLLQPALTAMTIRSAILSVQGRIREHLAACAELLEHLDWLDEQALAGRVADYDAEATCKLRLAIHEIRVTTRIKEGDKPAVDHDVRAILQTLPRLAAMPARSIRSLMAASFALGIDRLAALIRESTAADHLLPLTTALELEAGAEPRVPIEVRKVAGDMQQELAGIREQLRNEEVGGS